MRKAGFNGPVHLHEPGRGADALHEDGLLRGHLRGRALRAVGDLGLHRARASTRTRRNGRSPSSAWGRLFFIGGALFGHYFLFPMTFRFLYTLRRPGHAVPAEDRRVLVLLLVVPAGARARLPDPGRSSSCSRGSGSSPRASCSAAGSSRSWARSSSSAFVTPTPGRGHPDGARRADDRPLRARRARGLAVREEAADEDEYVSGQRRSGPSPPAPPSRGGPGPR